MSIHDAMHRPLQSLRISVTDRCNLRCNYCMPEDEYAWLPRESLLTFEEITRLATVFASLGVRKLRLTGGEPLLRRDLPELVRMLRATSVEEIALTTNGLLLERAAGPLRNAGLDRVTVSLDTLRPERMEAFARSNRHPDVVRGIDAAREAGFSSLKINAVVVRGYNDDELCDLVEFAHRRTAEMRFIEYMDVGGATRWAPERVMSREQILDTLVARFGPATPLTRGVDPHAPAERWHFASGVTVGIIASTTAPFCRDCDRARLTADGSFLTCLYAHDGHDLRALVRNGAGDDAIAARVGEIWNGRTDRGAELRAENPDRGAFVPLRDLRADPHREMHVRGG